MKGSMVLFLSTIIAVSSGHPTMKTWPLNELYDAIQNLPKDSPIRDYAVEGADLVFDHIRNRNNEDFGHVAIPSPSGAEVWTKDELEKVVDEIAKSPVLGFYAQPALGHLSKENTARLLIPAVDISTWSATDIINAIQDPKTNPTLLPYLKKAEKTITDNNGKQKDVTLVTPVGLIPVTSNTPHYSSGYVFQSIYIQ